MAEQEESASAQSGLDFEETELKLALPGERKRGFAESLGLRLGRDDDDLSGSDRDDGHADSSESKVSGGSRAPVAKVQVVGWPPLGPFRKNALKSYRYVKVAVDGAPYLRKVNLETYDSYDGLLGALEEMFLCFTIRKFQDELKLVDLVNGIEYVPTYEDKEGDWMLVGDVPWKMFVETCKRLRLMKGSEVVNQALELAQQCADAR